MPPKSSGGKTAPPLPTNKRRSGGRRSGGRRSGGGGRRSRRRRRRPKPRFSLITKQGKAIEAKLKDIVSTEILEHRRVPREKLNEFLAKLMPESNPKTVKFLPQKTTQQGGGPGTEGAAGAPPGQAEDTNSMTFVPKAPGKRSNPNDVLKLPAEEQPGKDQAGASQESPKTGANPFAAFEEKQAKAGKETGETPSAEDDEGDEGDEEEDEDEEKNSGEGKKTELVAFVNPELDALGEPVKDDGTVKVTIMKVTTTRTSMGGGGGQGAKAPGPGAPGPGAQPGPAGATGQTKSLGAGKTAGSAPPPPQQTAGSLEKSKKSKRGKVDGSKTDDVPGKTAGSAPPPPQPAAGFIEKSKKSKRGKVDVSASKTDDVLKSATAGPTGGKNASVLELHQVIQDIVKMTKNISEKMDMKRSTTSTKSGKLPAPKTSQAPPP